MPQFEQQNGEMRGWQLKPSDRLSQNQYKAISTLIYETDPYIICVDKRMRGQGIGRKMMTAFMEEHSAEPMELCVLADNPGAICLYENMGFRIANEATEFSLSESKPKCYDMTRPKAAE